MLLTGWSLSVSVRLHNREKLELLKKQQLLTEQKQKVEKESQQKIQQLEKEKTELEKKLQAKAQVRVASVKQYALPADQAKAFIYKHESGNRPHAVNSRGCIGLGQACPSGPKPKLVRLCPNWQTDYACQDKFWDDYARIKYGGWSGAYQYWLAHKNW